MSARTIRATHRIARSATLLAATAITLGCATPQPPTDTGFDHRWSGRFTAGWTDATPGGGDRVTGRFALAAGAGQATLEVLSPLGQTLVRAHAGPRGAWLETADGQRHTAETPEALTEVVLGWRIPVLRLPAWLADDRPDEAVEDDWEVRVDARDPSRPRRLSLRWPAAGGSMEGRSVAIRLIIDESLPASGARP